MATQTQEILGPPERSRGLKWLQENLFSSVGNTILTIVSAAITYFLVTSVVSWVFFKADWRPVTQFPLLYAVGQYPRDQIWRVGTGLSAVIFLMGASWGRWNGMLRGISISVGIALIVLAIVPIHYGQIDTAVRFYLAANVGVVLLGFLVGRIKAMPSSVIIAAWLLTPIVYVVLLGGFQGSEVLSKVATTAWGGLLVTFLLAVGGIVLSFPIGVLLALGRRSKLPVVSVVSTVFIEVIRGVPLITILFMFSVILTLFLPPDARLDRLLRALMAVTFFSAAYTAENVRGGLQAVPSGQEEAAKALGMSGLQTTGLIVLPQAIKAVLPAIVGQFISLFKDTTLVVIVGLNDFLGIGKSILNSDPEYVQLQTEVYLFVAIVYWIFSYLMSLASRKLEESLGGRER